MDTYLTDAAAADGEPIRRQLLGWREFDPLLWLTVGYLALCIIFGGASAAGFLANAFLQLIGLVIIAWLVIFRPTAAGQRMPSHYVLLGILFVAIAAIQLIPLPPQIWQRLSGRESMAREYQLLGMSDSWAPISMAPQATVRAIVSMVPPLAMTGLVSQLSRAALPVLLRCFVAIVAICALLGIFQIGTGSFYFYSITNLGKSVGFFANSNHQATLMLSMLPLAIAARRKPRAKSGKRSVDAVDLMLAASVILAAVCSIGTQSLAAVGLLGVAVTGAYMTWIGDKISSPQIFRRLAIATVVSMILLIGSAFFLSQVTVAASLDPTEGNRLTFAHDTIRAIRNYGILGSGLGSF